MRRYSFILGLLLLLTACFPARQPIQRAEPLSDIIPPVFELVPGQTFVERFDPPGAGANVDLMISTQVRNPNSFGITLNKVDFEITLAGRRVLRGELEPAIFIGAGREAPLRFPLSASLEGRNDLIKAVAQSYTGTPLGFIVEGQTSFASLNYAFDSRRTVLVAGEMLARDTVTPPALTLNETASRVFLLRADVPVIQVVMEATNPGEVGYFVYGKDVAVLLNGVQVALQDIVPEPVPAGQTGQLTLLYYPDMTRLSDSAMTALNAALSGTTTGLELQGELLMDVLGVDTFAVADGWNLSGFVDSD